MPKIIVGEAVEFENEILESGQYSAFVKKAVLGIVNSGANNGAEKLELHIRINDKTTVKEMLIFSPSMQWKINNFVKATSLADVGDELDLGVENTTGLKFDVYLVKEKHEYNGKIRDINTIKRFIKPVEQQAEDDLAF